MAGSWPKNRMGAQLTETQREIVRLRQSGYRKDTIQDKLNVSSTTVDYALYKAKTLGYSIRMRDRDVNTRPGDDCYRVVGVGGHGYWRQVIGGTEEDARRQWQALGGDITEAGPL